MGRVLFVSQNVLGRCENMTALYSAYDGEKEFACGIERMETAEEDGYSVVVCDALPHFIQGKDKVKSVNICHGMTGNKVYGNDEDGWWVVPDAFAQTDYAIAASDASVPIVAGQLGIPEERVLPIGFPRTDAYFSGRGGGTSIADGVSYLYAPTYRDADKGGWLPRIDWGRVDACLQDGETFAVKRHYFTGEPLLDGEYAHVVEIDPSEPIAPYLMDCDAVLTDYSSVMTDAYLLEKPVVLTLDDMDEYQHDRPMYYAYPRSYCSRWLSAEGNERYLVAKMRRAVERGMTSIEWKYRELTAGACDGHSTERICRLITELAEVSE